MTENLSRRVLEGLEEWASPAHSSRFMDFYLGLLAIQVEAEESLPPPRIELTKDERDKRLLVGEPLLALGDLELDCEKVSQTFHSIALALGQHPEVMGEVPAPLTQPGFKLPREWVEAWLESGELPAEAGGSQFDPRLLATLFQQTMRPFLIGYARALKGSFDQDKWRRCYCPVCGGKPEFAYLEKEAGARWLLCSNCSAEWLFQRLECPFCGNSDRRSLSYLTSDDGLYRLYLCERCQGYLKAIDLRKASRDYLLPLEALTTIALDRQAQETGYHPGGL